MTDPYELRTATDDDFVEMVVFDGRAFGDGWPDEQLASMRKLMDLDRFVVVRHGTELVGVAGSFEQELTVPGGAQVRAGGVTWVAVAPTHRRRGLLRRMMEWVHTDIDAHGEPIAMLTASEGSIYERFGYGVATQWRVMSVDRRRAQMRPEFVPPPETNAIRITDMADSALFEIFERYRRQRVGEIRRSQDHIDHQRDQRGSNTIAAIHADGYAVWKVEPNWNFGHPEHQLMLNDLVAVTPEAHAALWNLVLSVDLIGPIISTAAVSVDDELPYLLDDPRAVRTTDLNDMLWVHLRDVKRALAARSYGSDDAFVVEVDGHRWKVDGSLAGAAVSRVRTRPHLVTDGASIGAMYLGGVRPSTLARARRLTAASADVLRRADHFFAADRQPHTMTGF